jgi:hypothetical protein
MEDRLPRAAALSGGSAASERSVGRGAHLHGRAMLPLTVLSGCAAIVGSKQTGNTVRGTSTG